ncbi:hypothetical protein SAMN05877831_1295 [Rhodobacter maris]|uniref:Uncharacterized protein n=1 Tax=Rhodobacter maris TaxID=446682 RepID=A0A285TJ73_9RHOB|nr:hypothetical protein SAMN05877831_1295 [Rhodobacter maris]
MNRRREVSPIEGQVNTKLVRQGWAIVKGRLLCPGCDARRRAFAEDGGKSKVEKAGKTGVLRAPSREMLREINQMLDVVYNVDAGRYRGAETDVTVAEAIGNGCLFGWVAEERRRAFGDSGENDEMQVTKVDLGALAKRVEAALADRRARQCEIEKAAAAIRQEGEALAQLFGEVQRAMGKLDTLAKSVLPRGAK